MVRLSGTCPSSSVSDQTVNPGEKGSVEDEDVCLDVYGGWDADTYSHGLVM